MAELDFASLMRQAQAVGEKLKELKERVAHKTVEGSAGGGLVKVTVDGTLHVRAVEIDRMLLESNDLAMLQDLVAAATNDGLERAQKLVAEEIGSLGPLEALRLAGFGGK